MNTLKDVKYMGCVIIPSANIEMIVYSTVYSGADQRKYQGSASLAFVRGIHRGPMDSPYKGPVTRKMFPFDDVIMQTLSYYGCICKHWQSLIWLFTYSSQKRYWIYIQYIDICFVMSTTFWLVIIHSHWTCIIYLIFVCHLSNPSTYGSAPH